MHPRRSTLDWILEAVALAAFLALIALVATHWNDIPTRSRFVPPRALRPWSPHLVLGIMVALDAGTYVLLTLAGQFQRLVSLPADIDRQLPRARQMILSMTIVLKAVAMGLFVYLSWTLIQVTTGHGRGLNPLFLALFPILVTAPLIFYTAKLRRYK